jgi:hypothetical protein
MTPDAIPGLLSAIYDCNRRKVRVGGNYPTAANARDMLMSSGFSNYVRTQARSLVRQPMGHIFRYGMQGEAVQDKFDQRLALELIRFANLKLTGEAKSNGPSYGVFCEAMLNTWNHARSDNKGRERWWASVYYDVSRKRACFTFLDRGMGIFKSHRLTAVLSVLTHLRILSSAQILPRIFNGEVASSTREPGRGNGLPGMYDHCKAGRIKSLTVVTNDVVGDVETDHYTTISGSFEGTLLYWEI